MTEPTVVEMAIALASSVLALAFGYAVLVRGRKPRKARLRERAMREGTVATGVACASRHRGESTGARGSKGKPAMQELVTVDYLYRVGDREYRTSLGFQEPGYANIRYPEQVEVYYDARDPRKCVTSAEDPEAGGKLRGWYATLFLAMVVPVAVIRLLAGA